MSAEGTLEAASATPHPRVTSSFRYTNGRRPGSRVIETDGGVISFGIANCWYLDSTFCSRFHHLKHQMGTHALQIVGALLLFMVTGGAALMLLLEVYLVARKQCSFLDSRQPSRKARL